MQLCAFVGEQDDFYRTDTVPPSDRRQQGLLSTSVIKPCAKCKHTSQHECEEILHFGLKNINSNIHKDG